MQYNRYDNHYINGTNEQKKLPTIAPHFIRAQMIISDVAIILFLSYSSIPSNLQDTLHTTQYYSE